MALKIKYCILLFLFVNAVLSQTQVRDSTSIQTFNDKITARIGLVNTSNSFIFNDLESNRRFNLSPNTREYLGISVLFRSVELDLGFSPNFLKQNRDNDNSKLLNLNFRMFLGQWMQTIDVYRQKGFFEDFEGQETAYPDVKTLKIGGSTSYIFNPNFSFRAVGFQNEWQRKSAGSFIPTLYYYYSNFDINTTGITNQTKNFDIAVAPSYYYNFVLHENFILGVGASSGFGLNLNTSGERTITSGLLELGGRASIGYNSERFFAGVNSSLNIFEHKEKRSVRIDDQITFLEFYIGYRLKAPKSFMRMADKVNKFLGI
ncbi:uncharacterized protein DUF4421 [Winogradskyella wandonensis]|uniref:Uncharacterized protein DUF4421 n=1 Tax=Winogradskyella wandonensis TaxID=1442586 RepID=A0A4R1KRT9_9FLAO|nr:DUF4421 family protein [Winogradskyella wandonensis]TCK67732.1 uncharacterized protein DUF4421 [Winogradskyella wandonensis]